MDKRARAQQLLAELGKTLKVESLMLDDATDSTALLIDGKLLLNIEYEKDAGRLVLSSRLGELPEENRRPLLRELLMANLYWHRTQGATLGLDEHSGGVMLTQAKGVGDMDRQGFETLVETFLNQAERWGRRIAEKPADASGAAASTMLGNRAGLMIFG